MKCMAKQNSTTAIKKPELVFPEKHFKALKGIALIAVLDSREKHPAWNLNETLADLVRGFNPDMPPRYLLEFTQHIIQHWVTLEAKQTEAIAA
jgi:hypothetical protein